MRKFVLLGGLSVLMFAACQSNPATPFDPRNATYTIEKRTVTLSNGVFEEAAAPGSASSVTMRLRENGGVGELNGDGRNDAAVILTSSGGGSGTFYYLVVLRGDSAGKGDATNAVLLGDRIAVDAVKIEDGTIKVDVLDRQPGEPFTTAPSVKGTRSFRIQTGTLVELR